MRPHELLFPAVVVSGLVQAQQPFEKYYVSTSSYQENVIELSSHNLLTALARAPGISLLDAGGNVVESNCYWSDSILTMQSIQRYSDNDLYFVTGYRRDSCTALGSTTVPYNYPVIGRMDSSGNVVSFRYYALSASEYCGNVPADLEIISNKSILTWGRENHFFALKVDSALSPVWARRFSNHGGFRFIKELPGGDLLAGFDMDTAGASVARLDEEGNIVWCKSYLRPSGRIHDVVIESDSAFVVTGYTESTPGSQLKLYMMKLNGNGQVQWCRGYDSGANKWYVPQWSRIDKAQDGRYVVLATLAQQGNGSFYRPFLMKTDPNGDTLWTRSVGANGYVYYTRDLLCSADGGFLFSGIVWGALPEGQSGLPYIFKTDSLGHFACAERTQLIQMVELFPEDSSFTLSSIDGAAMHFASVSDTVFNPISGYDACLTLSAGTPLARYSRIRLHPNPNDGHFTFTLKDPLMADSWYSVYDATGKLLYQRPLPAGKGTEEVDLSRYGKGTYVIKCTDKDGVYHERVVVE